mmetsp:Transcript_19700/g.14448  ORF Transcript_19700/g.14448 Transcript_19700/m.14448 type:complete len:80 (+) Transcript_19700:1753-1992(+)
MSSKNESPVKGAYQPEVKYSEKDFSHKSQHQKDKVSGSGKSSEKGDSSNKYLLKAREEEERTKKEGYKPKADYTDRFDN